MFTKELNLRLGEILIKNGVITQEQLEKALREQKSQAGDQKRIGSYFINLGYATEEDITKALGMQFNLPVMRLEDLHIKPEMIDLIPESIARKFNIIPLFKVNGELTIAISDPTDIQVMDIVSAETRSKITPIIAPYSEISKTIDRLYFKMETPVAEITERFEATDISKEIEDLKKAGIELSIVKIVNRIMIAAVEDKASDIHIEPREDKLSVRFRIDGILHEYNTYPLTMHRGIVSRIKILSFLDISEKQKPQDGRIQIKIGNREIEIRVSTLPTLYGEKVVIRLLDTLAVAIRIEDLGFSEKNLNSLLELIREPYGIILVTGPTGSGKTTTLYAVLNEINSIGKNIITIEDPIEYKLPIINQIQVNPKKDLTFANTLKFILRQDPDIIMVGEIRDPETASIAAESALTGHLVLSTLHTNDAISSITRLIDMGVEPFLLAPSLIGIIAQRLVRKICSKCKEEYVPSSAELNAVGLSSAADEFKFYKGVGCDSCKHTGYKGRTGIYEIFVVDEKIKGLIINKAGVVALRQEASRKDFKDMRFDGLKKVFAGITTVEEILRVTRDIK